MFRFFKVEESVYQGGVSNTCYCSKHVDSSRSTFDKISNQLLLSYLVKKWYPHFIKSARYNQTEQCYSCPVERSTKFLLWQLSETFLMIVPQDFSWFTKCLFVIHKEIDVNATAWFNRFWLIQKAYYLGLAESSRKDRQSKYM